MEENFDALEVIARTRGKVEMDERPTKNSIFLYWGWPTVVFFTLMFVLWQWLHQGWCLFVWAGIPLVGAPLTINAFHKDRERTHIRTHSAKMVIDYWVFVGAFCLFGGFLYGFNGLGLVCYYPLIALLIGLGAFITGEALRFKPMIVGGILGSVIGVGAFLLQGDNAGLQILSVAVSALFSMVVPGYFYLKHFQDGI
jgi:hypothetical protein